MNNGFEAICSNSIRCSFCSETLLECLGNWQRGAATMSCVRCSVQMKHLNFIATKWFPVGIFKALEAPEHDNRAILSMEHYAMMFLESK
jgi:hypothetical protein